MIVAITIAMLSALSPVRADASRVVVTGNAEIRVWVDRTTDVFASYDDVVVSFHPLRDCYASVFVVDTRGYVHVVYPFASTASDARARVRGGVTYRYSAFELGLDALRGEGIAYVFAVGSPRPFDYSNWGDGIFVGHFGYRVYGDPYVAARQFYLSLLPEGLNTALISVSATRFYVGQWERYPSYLCYGIEGFHVRVGDYCRSCSRIYDGYRLHVAAPDQILHPFARIGVIVHSARIKRMNGATRGTALLRQGDTDRRLAGIRRGPSGTRTRVVSTSRTVNESMREYKEKNRSEPRRAGSDELASAARSTRDVREYAITERTPSAPKGKPTTQTEPTKTASERKEKGKARSASKKAR